ncbi:MAG: hypothetical protein QOE48_6168 [Mycobacterium sp.]|nr:hypothetical protein [Mycobacterium sp.]
MLRIRSGAFDLFDEAVVALGAGVSDPGGDEGVHFGPPGVDGGGQREQFFFGDPRRQDLAGVVLGHDGMHIFAKLLSDKRSRARMSRRRVAHSGSARRSRRYRRSQGTRSRTLVSASLAILTESIATNSIASRNCGGHSRSQHAFTVSTRTTSQ